MKTFVDACVENPEVELDLERWVSDWHAGKGPKNVPLHEFLGMTWKEYARWIRDPESLGGIVDSARRRMQPSR